MFDKPGEWISNYLQVAAIGGPLAKCIATACHPRSWQRVYLPGESARASLKPERDTLLDYYDAGRDAIEGAARLAGLASVAQTGQAKSKLPLPENESIEVPFVVGLNPGSGPERSGPRPVREPESVADHPSA